MTGRAESAGPRRPWLTTAAAAPSATAPAPRYATATFRAAAPGASWPAVARDVTRSVVAVTLATGEGSGVILDDQGRIVTNNHVVADAVRGAGMRVTLSDGRSYGARPIGADPATDLAVIQITDPPDDLTPIRAATGDSLTVGEPVMAVSNPLGLAGTVTTGIVSALDRPVTTRQSGAVDGLPGGGRPVITNAIQTSAPINPGNSGGEPSGNIGIGFAIPITQVTTITDQLIKTGTADHAYLGVTLADALVPTGTAQRAAARIGSVTPGSPADRAGLRPADAIVAIDGEAVNGALALMAQVNERNTGESPQLTVLRGDTTRQAGVTFTSLAARR